MSQSSVYLLVYVKWYLVQPQPLILVQGYSMECCLVWGVLRQPERSLLSNFFTPGTSIQKKNGFRQKKQPGIKRACISLNSEEP